MADDEKVRIDKWLWAARFFKTRSQAGQAVSGGKVHLNGARTKAASRINIGDELRIRKGPCEFVVIVQALAERRRSAPEARTLYEETEESRRNRETAREERKLLRSGPAGPVSRPGKRDRRLIKKFIRKDFD